MAADDHFKAGGGLPNQKNANASNQPKDAKKETSKILNTQNLRALAPSNELARSALEMRQNLEKCLPPGPQRDQLIEQLKKDVTPILWPELAALQAEQGKSPDQVLREREARINNAIERAAQLIADRLGQFEKFSPVREVASASAAVIDHLRSVLHDPRRNKGEFQIAIGTRDNRHFSSSRYFETSTFETFAYERQTAQGLSDLQVSGYAIEVLVHSHQSGEGKDATHFSNADIEQADALQAMHSQVLVRAYLLTPAPENILLAYVPSAKDKLPMGEAVGFFAPNGNFEVKKDKYVNVFASANLTVA